MCRSSAVLALSFLSLTMNVPSRGAAFEDGRAAFDRGDYAAAFAALQPLASEGEGDAQLFIGILYENGLGLPRNYDAAVRWYGIAAEQGLPSAQNNLAAMYAAGQGVPQDYAQAAKWYRRAAEQGDPAAQSNLGYIYYKGAGTQKNYTEALKWYRRSADQGFADAQRMLGVLYENGYGVQKDPAEARRWFERARSRAQGSPARDKPADRGVSPTAPAPSGKAQAAAVDSKSR